MNSRQSPPRAFRIEGWLVEPSLNEISAGDLVHHLEPKVMELLVLLSERPGEVVAKETLIERLWPERAVTDAVITTTVWELRRALGDDAKKPRYIQTIPRRGYRLIAAVAPVHPAAQPPASFPQESAGSTDDHPRPVLSESGPGPVPVPALFSRHWILGAGAAIAVAVIILAGIWQSDGRRERDRSGESAEARAACLEGRRLWKRRTEEESRAGLAEFERAIRLAPDYAPAHAGVADAYIQLINLDALRPAEGYPLARAAALRAIELDENLAEAHAALGMIRLGADWDWKGAEASFRRAIELDDSCAKAHNWFGQYLWAAGRAEEALREIETARALDPQSISIQMTAGSIYYYLDRTDEAVACFRRALDLDPQSAVAWKSLGKVYEKRSQMNEAGEAFRRFAELTGASASPRMVKDLARRSRKDDAEFLLEKLSLFWRLKYVRPSYIARVYLDIGDREQAMAWLERGYSERDSNLLQLKVDPSWDALRDDPRFAALAERTGPPM